MKAIFLILPKPTSNTIKTELSFFEQKGQKGDATEFSPKNQNLFDTME